MRCAREPSSFYLAEVFAPRGGLESQRAAAERLDAAVTAHTSRGERVRHLHSLFVPDEETTFHLLESEGPAVVDRVLRDAGVEAERIHPAISVAGNGRGEVPAPAIGRGGRYLPGR
ncbi:MAG TPA: hypothetical protein VFJ60_00785 [Gaiella sp.]|nr:hypothetical protein [Gaiella sp.]